MALLAGILCVDMFPVTEVHKTRNLINPNPLDLPVIFPRMAGAANLGLWQCHRLTRIGIRMAHRTLQLQIARMDFVAVRHGLLRRILAHGDSAQQEQKDTNELSHKLPFRISSAM
jgi:hypothetical protein